MPFPFQLRRYTQLLTKHLGLLGHVPTVLLEDVQPMLDVLSMRGDLAYLKQEHRFGRYVTSPAVAGQLSRAELSLPPGQRKVLLVEYMLLSCAADWQYEVRTRTVFSAVGGNGAPRDGRLIGGPQSAGAVVGFQSVASALSTPIAFHRPTSGAEGAPWAEVTDALIVAPGSGLIVESLTVNTAVTASFGWREVPISPQEDSAA